MRIAFVFDMDGVLFDSHPMHRNAWRCLLRQAGKDVSESDLDWIMEGGTREEILRHFLGPLSPQQVAFYAIQKDAILRQEEQGIRTVDGLEAFLNQAASASIPMAVASSASRERVTRMLESRGLTPRFAVILTGDDVSSGKSNPAIFLRAAEQLHARTCEVLVFEDAVSAVRIVKQIGMKCIGIARGKRRNMLVNAGADLVVANYMHLELSDITKLFHEPVAGARSWPA